jgi:acetyl-CoA carboxylase alpha subunit
MKEKLLPILVESIDLKKLANGIIDEVIEEALKKVVADSSNTIDDMVMASLWPLLEKEVKKLVEEKLDLGKILGMDDEANV